MIGRRATPSTQVEDKPKGFDDYELRLGDIMRGERATLAKSLLDVQRELKIKASYVAAIENADVSAFETPGFVAGYVRSYARYLGLDPEWAYKRFCQEANFTVSHGMSAEASGPKPKPRQKVEYSEPLANPNASFVPQGKGFFHGVEPGAVGSVLVLAFLAFGIGYGGWTVLQEVQKVQLAPVDQAPGLVAELDPIPAATASPGDVLPSEGDEQVAVQLPSTDAFDRLYRPQALDVPVLVARDGPIAAIDPNTVGALASPQTDAIAMAVAEAVSAEEESPVVRTVAEDAPAVELLAVRPAWVRVTGADGTVIFEKILDAGERYALPKSEEPPTLHAGNSGAVYFAVNGDTYGPAAPGAQVVKNVVLSPDALLGAYALADVTQDPELANIVNVAEASPTQ
ncbi:helix-turn-helix domain-containing protein [Ostreiculturibacter nitratireducens]|uniref:helix-turn-helix domain-containing protein n=1 Tax=Ostreiculturibacter nitratireducens TaxID=3075226 RepID=UPI0031B60B7A